MEKISNIKIRKVNFKDVQSIVKLHRKVVSVTNAKQYGANIVKEWLSQITKDSVKNQLKVKTTSWYLLELGNKIIGFCQFPIAKGVIYQLNIDPEYQGNGYGKILYYFMEKKFIESGAKKIELNSTSNALSFYENLGFEIKQPIKYKLINSEMHMFEMIKILQG